MNMIKVNRKGFTLIELLAVIIILGVILTIAIPSTVSMIDRNKKKTLIDDAKNMITLTEYTIRKNTKIDWPAEGKAIIVTLGYLNTNDIEKSPYNTNYSLSKSFVVVVNKTSSGYTEYKYYAHLVACSEDECDSEVSRNRGFSKPLSLDDLNNKNVNDLVFQGSKVEFELIEESDFTRIATAVDSSITKVYELVE